MAKFLIRKLPIWRVFPAKGYRFILRLKYKVNNTRARATKSFADSELDKAEEEKRVDKKEVKDKAAVEHDDKGKGKVLEPDFKGNEEEEKTAADRKEKEKPAADCKEKDKAAAADCKEKEKAAAADCKEKEKAAAADCKEKEKAAAADCKEKEKAAAADCKVKEKAAAADCKEKQKAAAADCKEKEKVVAADCKEKENPSADCMQKEKQAADRKEKDKPAADRNGKEKTAGVKGKENAAILEVPRKKKNEKDSDCQFVLVTSLDKLKKVFEVVGDSCRFIYPQTIHEEEKEKIIKFGKESGLTTLPQYDRGRSNLMMMWKKPRCGLKLNVSGTKLGIGGLIRDQNGKFMYGFMKRDKSLSLKFAKRKSFYYALLLVEQLVDDGKIPGISVVEFDREGMRDDEGVEILINSGQCNDTSWVHEPNSAKVEEELQRLIPTYVRGLPLLIEKSANFCARMLGKQAESLEEKEKPVGLNSPPEFLAKFIHIDTLSQL